MPVAANSGLLNTSESMTQSPIKVGMIGAGFILKPHAQAVAATDRAVLHAIADTSGHRAAQAARQFSFPNSFESVEELAKSDCDVVHILVPPYLHLSIAEKLINAGKSVFLEKPMGLSSAECARLGKLADAKGVRLGVNHNFLFLPGYERLRAAVAEGALGRADHLVCHWNFELPQIRSGPFDAWLLSAPANLFFELGPHLAAFVLDLLDQVDITAAVASKAIDLPTGQRVYRAWNVLGGNQRTGFSLSISATPGQADRILRLRGSGGSAQYDFGRDIFWEEHTQTVNPIFDAYAVAKGIAGQVRSAAAIDRRRRIAAALRKSLASEPFTESMARSISAFYANLKGSVDPRHHWSFGTRTMQFCEKVCEKAEVGGPTARPVLIKQPRVDQKRPATTLVVGGTGFIGRSLVAKLIDKGVGVRVLSRSKNAAAIVFAGMPIDISEGWYGNPEVGRAALDGIDTVYHLSKCEGRSWDDYVRGDIEPTRVLAEAALKAGVKRFIYTGTIDSYDSASPAKHITSETSVDPRIGKRNLYARSKAACEALLQGLALTRDLPLIIMRPAIVIGPGTEPSHLGVAHFASETNVRYWGDGDNKLPLVLVDDVADALARATVAPDIVGKSFVLTSEPMLSARDYVGEIANYSGVKVTAKARAPWRNWCADIFKEVAKNLIKHPNRRWSTLHDWKCRAHRSHYDSSAARAALGWQPVSDRETFVQRGIRDAVDAALNPHLKNS